MVISKITARNFSWGDFQKFLDAKNLDWRKFLNFFSKPLEN